VALDTPSVAVSRFADEPTVILPLDQGLGAHTLVLPKDALIGTDAVVPYRLSGIGGVIVCVER
jgi:hypothetical protein